MAVVESWGLELDYSKAVPLLALDGTRVVADATLHYREGGPLRLVGRVKWLLAPEWRGVGLGTQLVQIFIKMARENGLRHLNCMLIKDLESDAVETLRRVMENRGEQLIATAVDPQWQSLGFAAFVPVSEYCQLQLAAWHNRAPQALAIYRQQVDPVAARHFDEAMEEHSEAKLQRIVDEMLLSMTPHADPFDGKLTLAFGYRGTRMGLFMALPKAFNEGKGSYVELEGMRELHTTRVSIHLDRPSPAHTDGELFESWITDLEYKIFPSAVNLLVP